MARLNAGRSAAACLNATVRVLVTVRVMVVAGLIASGCSSQVAAPVVDPTPTPIPVEQTAVVAAAPTPTIDPARAPIMVGVVMADSGVMAAVDKPALAAMRWQTQQINDAGGVAGRPLELRLMDSESRFSTTEAAAEQLIADGAVALMVTCDADLARPAVDVANEAAVLTISPCASDLDWFELGFGSLSFTFGNSALMEGTVMADVAADAGASSAALFIDRSNPDAVLQCQGFAERFFLRTGTEPFTYSFLYEETELLNEQLAASGVPQPSVAVVCSHLPGGLAGGPTVIESVRTAGIGAPIIAGSTLDGNAWTRAVQGLGDLTVVTPHSVHGDDPQLSVNQLFAGIDDGSGALNRGWAVQGADAVEALARAIERAPVLEGVAIAAALEQFSGEVLVSGPITFSPQQHMDPGRPLRVVEFGSGSPQVVVVRAPAQITTGS